jgi:hypothetical protein
MSFIDRTPGASDADIIAVLARCMALTGPRKIACERP